MVAFTCGDGLSGVASCPAAATLASDGFAQSVSGVAVDVAGNTASATVSGINIDQTPPSLSVTGVTGGSKYTVGAAPTVGCTASDSLSGLAGPCSVTVTGGNANGVGTFTATGTVTDKAGNTSTQIVVYKIVYGWNGFLQPITDTAHQTTQSLSVFKAGSTVPTKFSLTGADGTIVQPVSAPIWLTPANGGPTSLPVDQTLSTAPADSGWLYALNGSIWKYNWKTSSTQAGFYWRIGVLLDDGEAHYVDIALR
jgi:hypothetical protein